MSNAPQSGSSMFDSRFVVTLLIAFAVWMGWQAYMTKKYPNANAPEVAKTATGTGESVATNVTGTNGADSATNGPKVLHEKVEVVPETSVTFEDSVWSFRISSRGMALRDVKLKKYTDRQGQNITFGSDEDLSLFGTGLSGRRDQINFSIRRDGEIGFVGTAEIDGMKITKIMTVESATYSVKTVVRAEKLTDAFTGFTTTLAQRLHESGGGSFLMPSFEHQEFFARHDGSNSREVVDNKNALVETYAQTSIAAMGSQYFTTAIVDRSQILAEYKVASVLGEKPLGVGTLTHTLLNKADKFSLEYISYAGPKSYDLLKAVDADMVAIVNFGFFQSIAKGILWLMKVLYAAIGNWGIAIILLTILVRIVVLPFNIIGYKQMKAMAKIQPAMKALREKYKADPQRLNQEMLALMKESKANPLGGCLPMFLQIPIFFALYQVIGQSIELYQAPFMFWIHDLSLKDPFYVLPILMGITMVIQQKITPNTLEPAQQKIMMFLPIFFTFLMVALPSGLTLYIFISSVFGVVQQLYFTKDNTTVGAKA